MPDLTKISVPKHQANQPYHWKYDNLPLEALERRDEVINNAVDEQSQILNDAAGTQNNLAVRLDQSIDEDGNLKSEAVDESLHNIAKHIDGVATVDSEELDYYNSTLGYAEVANPVPFVRMLESERDKLSLMPSDATSLALEFCSDISCTPSNIVLFNEGTLQFQSSSFITWEINNPAPGEEGVRSVKPVLNTSLQFAHRHYYDIGPALIDETTNEYDASGTSVPYIEGSLRVYINGTKLSSEYEVFYPKNPADSSWTSSESMIKGGSNKFTPDHESGTFTLLNSITEDDIIRVDFDIALS